MPRGLRARRPIENEHFKATIAESLTGMLAEHFKQVDEHFALARAVVEGL